jgi:hypothetical protein
MPVGSSMRAVLWSRGMPARNSCCSKFVVRPSCPHSSLLTHTSLSSLSLLAKQLGLHSNCVYNAISPPTHTCPSTHFKQHHKNSRFRQLSATQGFDWHTRFSPAARPSMGGTGVAVMSRTRAVDGAVGG